MDDGRRGRAGDLQDHLSLALAAVIGCERSSKRHSAGMRTFMLVSVSATAAVLTDMYLAREFSFVIPVISGAAVVALP